MKKIKEFIKDEKNKKKLIYGGLIGAGAVLVIAGAATAIAVNNNKTVVTKIDRPTLVKQVNEEIINTKKIINDYFGIFETKGYESPENDPNKTFQSLINQIDDKYNFNVQTIEAKERVKAGANTAELEKELKRFKKVAEVYIKNGIAAAPEFFDNNSSLNEFVTEQFKSFTKNGLAMTDTSEKAKSAEGLTKMKFDFERFYSRPLVSRLTEFLENELGEIAKEEQFKTGSDQEKDAAFLKDPRVIAIKKLIEEKASPETLIEFYNGVKQVLVTQAILLEKDDTKKYINFVKLFQRRLVLLSKAINNLETLTEVELLKIKTELTLNTQALANETAESTKIVDTIVEYFRTVTMILQKNVDDLQRFATNYATIKPTDKESYKLYNYNVNVLAMDITALLGNVYNLEAQQVPADPQ